MVNLSLLSHPHSGGLSVSRTEGLEAIDEECVTGQTFWGPLFARDLTAEAPAVIA